MSSTLLNVIYLVIYLKSTTTVYTPSEFTDYNSALDNNKYNAQTKSYKYNKRRYDLCKNNFVFLIWFALVG